MIRKNRPLRDNFILIGSICTLLVAMIVWASIFKIIQTARAQGQVIAIARTQVIQAAIDGVIQAVLVQEGQIVKKGDILVKLLNNEKETSIPALKTAVGPYYHWSELREYLEGLL